MSVFAVSDGTGTPVLEESDGFEHFKITVQFQIDPNNPGEGGWIDASQPSNGRGCQNTANDFHAEVTNGSHTDGYAVYDSQTMDIYCSAPGEHLTAYNLGIHWSWDNQWDKRSVAFTWSQANGPHYYEDLGGPNPAEPQTSCSCADPVDTATGAYTESFDDLAVADPLGLAWSRSYSSAAAAIDGPLGHGWTSPWFMHVSTGSSGDATVVESNGSQVPFTSNGSGGFTAPARVRATLTHNSDGTWTYVRKHMTTFSFNSDGNLTRVTDLAGQHTDLAYDSNSQLSTITGPSGRALTLTWSSGHVASVSDPLNRTVSYGYSGGDLSSATSPGGHETDFGYDSSHRMTTLTRPRGGVTTNTYDSLGRVESQSDPRGKVTTFGYTATTLVGMTNNTTRMTDPDGVVTDFRYSGGVMISKSQNPDSAHPAMTFYSYDPNFLTLTGYVDPDGVGWHGTVWPDTGDLYSRQRNDLTTSYMAYNSFDEPTSVQGYDGTTTSYAYDSVGNLTEVDQPVTSNTTATTTYTYDNTSFPTLPTKTTDPRGHDTTMAYNSHGDLASVTDADNRETTFGHDAGGRTTTVVSPRGNVNGANAADFTTTTAYTQDGQVASVTNPLGQVTGYGWDADGNRHTVTTPGSHTTTTAFNLADEPTTVTLPDNTTSSTSYTDGGRVASRTDANEHTESYSYNDFGQLASVTEPGGQQTSYTYTPAGRAATVTDPDSRTTTETWDVLGELSKVHYSDSATPDVSFAYDIDSRPLTMSDGTGTTTWTYDKAGEPLTVTDGDGNHLSYGWDLDGNQTSITYPDNGQLQYQFDDANQMTGLTDYGNRQFTFGYNPDGALSSIGYPNGVTDSRTYNRDDEPTNITDTSGSGANPTPLASFDYTWTNEGQQATANTTDSAATTTSVSFAYDSTGRLSNATPASAVTAANAFTFDDAGNVTGMPDGVAQAFNSNNQVTSRTDSTGATSYSYNVEGDRTSQTLTPTSSAASTTAYGYDQASRLTSYTAPDNTTASYTYFGDGLRATKTTGGSSLSFTWDRTTSVPTLVTDSAVDYLYGPGGIPVEQVKHSGWHTDYLHVDAANSVRLLTDTSGAADGTATYSPYGVTTAASGQTSALGYDGQYTDSESGLVYLRARYYDPATGQFLTRDPANLTTGEPYSYTGGDPVDRADPTGLVWWNPVDDVKNAVSCVKTWGAIAVHQAAADVNAVTNAAGHAGADFGEWVYAHPGQFFSAAGIAVCITLSVGTCAVAVTTALAARSLERYRDKGLRGSWKSDLGDAALTGLGFGLAGGPGGSSIEELSNNAALRGVVNFNLSIPDMVNYAGDLLKEARSEA